LPATRGGKRKKGVSRRGLGTPFVNRGLRGLVKREKRRGVNSFPALIRVEEKRKGEKRPMALGA